MGAGFPQLIRIDDEVLAQNGNVDVIAYGVQIGEGSSEAAALGQHTDRGRSARRVLAS